MILPFSTLKEREFSLSQINVFLQKPSYRRIEMKPAGRKKNGFLYILRGEGRYTFAGGSFLLQTGSVVYLPQGSRHVFEVVSDGIEFYRVDFDLAVDGEPAFFSDCPLKLCDRAGREFDSAIRALADGYAFLNDTVAKHALLCEMFRALSGKEEKRSARLEPAARYLLDHLTEKISCAHLASLCYLSTAQFYHLFREAFGAPPLEYRAALLADRAAYLLRTGSFSVTEAAESLGFESVSYFSRFFKKHKGLSPAAFLKNEP